MPMTSLGTFCLRDLPPNQHEEHRENYGHLPIGRMVKRPRPIAWMMLDGISLIDGFFQFFSRKTLLAQRELSISTLGQHHRVYLRIVWSQLLYLLNSSIAHHLARKPSSIHKMRRNHHVWTNSISKHPWISSYWVIFSGPCRHLPTRKKNTTRYVAAAPCCRRRTKRPRLSLCCSGPGVKHYESPPGRVRNETQGGIEDANEAPSIRSLVCWRGTKKQLMWLKQKSTIPQSSPF